MIELTLLFQFQEGGNRCVVACAIRSMYGVCMQWVDSDKPLSGSVHGEQRDCGLVFGPGLAWPDWSCGVGMSATHPATKQAPEGTAQQSYEMKNAANPVGVNPIISIPSCPEPWRGRHGPLTVPCPMTIVVSPQKRTTQTPWLEQIMPISYYVQTTVPFLILVLVLLHLTLTE